MKAGEGESLLLLLGLFFTMSANFLLPMTTDSTLHTTTLLPSPTMKPIRELGFRYMNIYYFLSATQVTQGLKTIKLEQMKLITIPLPKDWARLTVLEAESL